MATAERPGTTRSPKTDLRNLGALYLGKILIGATRLLKQGGTTLPGRAALTISPQLLPFFAGQLPGGTVAVTGTNGKTTTAALLAAILKESGLPHVHNSGGANLAWGVATALIEAGTWKGELPAEIAVLEMDEGAFPAISEALRPRGAVVTNIFRDQLDRFGGVQRVQEAIQRGLHSLHPAAAVCLNADDPLVAAVDSGGRKTLYYGLDLPAGVVPGFSPGEEIPCPRCGGSLIYTALFYAHLGRYRCSRCGFRRPDPEIKLRRFTSSAENSTLLKMSLCGRSLEAALSLPGTYNLYNALAAAAAAAALNLPDDAIRGAFTAAAAPAGRMERRRIGAKELLIALIKNPAGANEVLRTLLKDRDDHPVHLLIAINDRIADGRDISWLGETDFEQLAALGPRIGGMIVSGTRSQEAKQRLVKAGFNPAEMAVEPSLQKALKKALSATAPEAKLIVLANYTAMMQLRRLMN